MLIHFLSRMLLHSQHCFTTHIARILCARHSVSVHLSIFKLNMLCIFLLIYFSSAKNRSQLMEPYLTLFKQERKTKEKQRIDKSRAAHSLSHANTKTEKKWQRSTPSHCFFSLLVCVISFARVFSVRMCVFIQQQLPNISGFPSVSPENASMERKYSEQLTQKCVNLVAPFIVNPKRKKNKRKIEENSAMFDEILFP